MVSGNMMRGLSVVLTGIALLLVACVFFPDQWAPLENFDPPKRLVWAMFALIVLLSSFAHFRLRDFRFSRGANARNVDFPFPPTRPFRGSAISVLPLALASWMIARTLMRSNPWAELGVLGAWLLPLIAYVSGNACGVAAHKRALSVWLAVAMLIQAGLMLLQAAGLDPLFARATDEMETAGQRMIGTIGYQNQAAAFLALSAGFVAFAFERRAPARLVLLAVFPVVCATGSRGAAIAMLFAALPTLGLLFPRARRKSGADNPPHCHPERNEETPAGRPIRSIAVMAGIVACLVASLFAIPSMRERLLRVTDIESPASGMGTRLISWRIACGMFLEKPIVGWGAGEYAYQYIDRLGAMLPEEKTGKILQNVVYAREAHNDYLQFAAEFGLVGCGLAAALFALLFRLAWNKRNESLFSSAAFFHTLFYMSVDAFVSFPWQTAVAGPLAGFLLGIGVSEGAGRKETPVAAAAAQATGPLSASAWLAIAVMTGALCAGDAFLTLRIPRITVASEALIESDKLLRIMPWAHKYQAILGALPAAAGEFRGAEVALTQAEKGFVDPILLNNLGHCYSMLGKWTDALRVYQRWADSGIEHRTALGNLSVALENLGRHSEAADVLARQFRAWPEWREDNATRRAALLMRGARHAEALALLTAFMRAKEAEGRAWTAETDNMRGAILLATERTEEAQKWFRRALEKKPELESARKNLDLTKPASPR